MGIFNVVSQMVLGTKVLQNALFKPLLQRAARAARPAVCPSLARLPGQQRPKHFGHATPTYSVHDFLLAGTGQGGRAPAVFATAHCRGSPQRRCGGGGCSPPMWG